MAMETLGKIKTSLRSARDFLGELMFSATISAVTTIQTASADR
jgi:hypothetical protein